MARNHSVARVLRCCLLTVAVTATTGCGQQRNASEREEDRTGTPRLLAKPIHSNVAAEGPMLVEIELRNESDSAIELRETFTVGSEWLVADITDAVGSPVELDASIFEPYAPPLTLGPGQVFRDTVDLRCDVGTREPSRNCVPPYGGLLNPGTYSITMKLTVPCEACSEYIELVALPFTVRVGPDSAGR